MSGRHRVGASNGWRWLAGASALAIAGAALVTGGGSAGASGSTVTATFSVLGVSTSNCTVSVGGSDIYLQPGDSLKMVTSAVGLSLGGVPLSTAQIASLASDVTTLPGTASAHTYNLVGTNAVTVSNLAAGNYPFTYSVKGLSLLGLTVPLSLTSQAVSAGAALTYAGTIHVTDSAPKCGLAVQLPGPSVSVSLTGVPPIKISLPPVNVSVPVDPGTLTQPPSVPTSNPGSGGTSAPPAGANGYTPPPPSVPEEVVPQGHGGTFLGSGGGFFGGALPDVSSVGTVNPVALAPVKSVPLPALSTAPAAKPQKAAQKTELAANTPPSAQLPVVLAIIAVIALAAVTMTYARLYLLRRP
jgi:hypothetical protein